MRHQPKKLKVAMIAPPWLAIPPDGYGGIEYLVHNLTVELRKLGHHIELFTVGTSTTPASTRHWLYEDGQYHHIHRTLYEAFSVPAAHALFALQKIKQDRFDIIHDHTQEVPVAAAYLEKPWPPILNTLHGPFSSDKTVAAGLPDNRLMYAQLAKSTRLYFNSISHALLKSASRALRPRIVGVVHNAVDIRNFTFTPKKKDYFLYVGRINRDKGVGVAARLCGEMGVKFKIAGIVAGITTARQLLLELANPTSSYRTFADFKYFSDEVLPQLVPEQIEYIGAIGDQRRLKIFGQAKGFLFPLDWEEPFGVAVIDALACGTPVVTFRRGSMPEIVEHGVNGFLAKNEREFKLYMNRIGEIDPATCRESVKQKFSSKAMAKSYEALYRTIIAKHK